jgi:pimeloyl-ACP methyl ester carboxylesterase
MNMEKTWLVQFKTTDNLLLPGLLYQPKQKTNKVALVLHGNGSSSVFYSYNKNRAFAKELLGKGISYFPFNNRGAHYVKSLERVVNGEVVKEKQGTTYELIKDCIHDIDGAVNYLKELGYSEFYILGFSTGANKICVYNYYKKTNPFKKYVLLGGGDDTGLWFQQVGSKSKFFAYLKRATEMIKTGKGEKLIPKYMLPYLFSYQSFYDICNPNGDYNTFPFNEYINNLKLSTKPLFKEYKSINKPTLVVYGQNDEYCYGSVPRVVDILKKEAPKNIPFSFHILKNADHGFSGAEAELASLVTVWLLKSS